MVIIKEMIPTMGFFEGDHHDGENMTVRRGVKPSFEWSPKKAFKAQHPITDDPGTEYFFGAVTRVTVKRFCDLTLPEVCTHHLYEARRLRGQGDLLSIMREVYGQLFDEKEICTLVFFEVLDTESPVFGSVRTTETAE